MCGHKVLCISVQQCMGVCMYSKFKLVVIFELICTSLTSHVLDSILNVSYLISQISDSMIILLLGISYTPSSCIPTCNCTCIDSLRKHCEIHVLSLPSCKFSLRRDVWFMYSLVVPTIGARGLAHLQPIMLG